MLTSDTNPNEQFLTLLKDALAANTFVSVRLGKYRGLQPELEHVLVRRVIIRDIDSLSLVYRYKTKDITENVPVTSCTTTLRNLLSDGFRHAQLLTLTQDIQLMINKKGKGVLTARSITHSQPAQSAQHDREKHRFLDLNMPFLTALGVTTDQHQLLPSMSAKWKQINKFIEVVGHAISTAALGQADHINVVDFGCGKGYLTFAIHDYLQNSLGIKAQVTGIELRDNLVQLCRRATEILSLHGLHFEQGDVMDYAPGEMHIMIALHACDTATDYAIYKGIRAGASVIVCSPCCHKQIRPQMQIPPLLHPVLRHGIHLGQEAEMVTDSLRALLLETEGYTTQVFEFISLEHTSKNKMIMAVKRQNTTDRARLLAQVQDIKAFYGIQEHCLETLLAT